MTKPSMTPLTSKPAHLSFGDLVLIEVLQGFKRDSVYNTARELLISLEVFILGGQEMAIKSAENFRLLLRRGITVRKTTDVLIATFCIERNLALLHSDKDFEPFHEYLKLSNAIS